MFLKECKQVLFFTADVNFQHQIYNINILEQNKNLSNNDIFAISKDGKRKHYLKLHFIWFII